MERQMLFVDIQLEKTDKKELKFDYKIMKLLMIIVITYRLENCKTN